MPAFLAGLFIVALRNEKGSYNFRPSSAFSTGIVALRNEKGSYNTKKGFRR